MRIPLLEILVLRRCRYEEELSEAYERGCREQRILNSRVVSRLLEQTPVVVREVRERA